MCSSFLRELERVSEAARKQRQGPDRAEQQRLLVGWGGRLFGRRSVAAGMGLYPEDVRQRVLAHVYKNRIKVKDFFVDFDRCGGETRCERGAGEGRRAACVTECW